MNAKTLLIDAYRHAEKKFQTSEQVLSVALDALNTRKATGGDITAEFKKTQRCYRECNAAWDTLEMARRAYWLHVAKEAEQELERLALPLLATIKHAHAAGRSGISGPVLFAVSSLAGKDLPEAAVDVMVPIAGVECGAIDRAEEDWSL
ncbi:MAG: hypothetical protein IPL72_06380 [Sulfuritalea sp.]|nr:hypothetical protein [Sulfuritalea sp.]